MPLISDSVGRVLGGRYRLVAALGTGASAHVFLAEDVSLRRRVAVKVLQPALARDASFLKRFEAEARSVASLNHPHVLRVFDWGEDADGPYLVLEYLQGGSLRDVLDHGVSLSQAQAARLGAEAAEGLAYAHARGLVHRDVKPANLLLDEEGRVRIADFGVARALAEAAWTEPDGAMIGTARYASPEQAQGQSVDGRSDVYSLALVLYEALTGEVPFVADTTMGTLAARVGVPLPHHPALGPLDDVLARAAAPAVGDRLDAARLAARLGSVAAALPPPAALPLRGAAPAETGPYAAGGDLTVQAPAAGAGHRLEVFDIDALDGPPAPARRRAPMRPNASTRRRWPWVLAAVVLAAAVAAGVVAAVHEKVFTASRPVPALTGLTLSAARQTAAADHFSVAVGGSVRSIAVPAGSVAGQQPRRGVSAKEGTALRVVVSSGPPTERVPPLSGLGLDCTGATRLLAADHFTADCPALLAYSPTVPAGQVINWSYDNRLDAAKAPWGATIAVAVSKGKPPVAVPAVAHDTSFTQAQSALQGVGLQATEVQESSTTVPVGQVVGTTPAAGAMATVGTAVKVEVSSGPPVVTVPTMSNDTVAEATAALSEAGLVVGQVYGPATGHVFTTVPLAGQQAKKGSAVNLYTQ
jgi:serine/threonine-protein kinase